MVGGLVSIASGAAVVARADSPFGTVGASTLVAFGLVPSSGATDASRLT